MEIEFTPKFVCAAKLYFNKLENEEVSDKELLIFYKYILETNEILDITYSSNNHDK